MSDHDHDPAVVAAEEILQDYSARLEHSPYLDQAVEALQTGKIDGVAYTYYLGFLAAWKAGISSQEEFFGQLAWLWTCQRIDGMSHEELKAAGGALAAHRMVCGEMRSAMDRCFAAGLSFDFVPDQEDAEPK